MKRLHFAVFELQAPKAVIKRGIFSRSYCCNGSLLCYENDNDVFTDSWHFFATMIVASSDKEWW